MASVQLQWKSFSVNVQKVHAYFKAALTSNYDGLVCDSNFMNVMFVSDVAQADSDAVSAYWGSVTAQTFAPTMNEVVSTIISGAINFGQTMIMQFAVENVQMGITQAGKTRDVSDFLEAMQRYLQSGSLYAAIQSIDDLIAGGVPPELAPFITVDRLTTYKHKIQTYLGAPLT